MPYSPIRLQQIDIAQLSGYMLDVVDGLFVLTTGDQNVSGEKSFYDGIEVYDGSGGLIFSSENFSLYQNWQMNGTTVGPSGIVNLPFLQTADFNLVNVVRSTGNQNVSGIKTFFNQSIFRSGALFSGNTEYSGTPSSIYGLVNLGFLQTGNFNLLNTVRATGNQNISGIKTHFNQEIFRSGISVSGNFEYSGNPTSIYGVVNLGFLQTGAVTTTGDQTVSGLKTFSDIYTLGQKIKRTVVNSSSYSVTHNDFYLAVNSSGSAKTLSFPIPSGDGKVFKVKDVAGQATGNNIILSGSGVTFDYSPTRTINTAYASLELIAGSGNNYEIF